MIICQQTRGLLSSNDQLALDLQFAADKSSRVDPNNAAGFLVNSRVGPAASFSRASGATEVNNNGFVVYARENLTWYSSELDFATVWTLGGATVTISGSAPDNSNAYLITESTDNSSHFLTNRGGTVVNSTLIQASTNYTASVFVKKVSGSVDWVQLSFGANGFGSSSYLNFNLSDGTFGSFSGSASGTNPTVTVFPDGWYRISYTVTSLATATTSNNIIIALTNNTNIATRLPTYVGNTANRILVSMAQFERGDEARDFILTSSSSRHAPRFDHDPAMLTSRGLLIEGSRTNLCFYSEALVLNVGWTSSSTTSTAEGLGPNLRTAYNIKETATNAIHTFVNTGGALGAPATSVVTGTTYTGSIFVKKISDSVDWVQLTLGSAGFGIAQYANFNISNGTIGNYAGLASGTVPKIEDYGNGWYRCSIAATATATTATLNVVVAFINNSNGTTRVPTYVGNVSNSILATMCQFEVGESVTSYIPTTSSSVIRSADVCSITGAEFSGMYNPLEGSVLFNSIYNSEISSTGQRMWEITDGTTNNFIRSFRLATTNFPDFRNTSGGSTNVTITGSTALQATQPYKHSFGFKADDYVFYVNNAQIGTDNLGAMPISPNTMYIGMNSPTIGGGQLNGTISAVRYYRKRLDNSKLQALTA